MPDYDGINPSGDYARDENQECFDDRVAWIEGNDDGSVEPPRPSEYDDNALFLYDLESCLASL